LEDKISSLGGKYEKAAEPWGVSITLYFDRLLTNSLSFQPKVVVTGNLITGQNPASAHPIGEAILQALEK
jgi:putative intracellular protease/amidase